MTISNPTNLTELLACMGAAGKRLNAIEAIEAGAGKAATHWALWRRSAGRWRFAVLPAASESFTFEDADAVVVSAVDRIGNVSTRQRLGLP